MKTAHPDGDGLREQESKYRRLLKQLTLKEQKLIHEYLIDGNATRAAKASGYSEKCAQQISSEVLLKPVVATALQAGRDMLAQRYDITADKIVKELVSVAFSSSYSFAEDEHGFGVAEGASPDAGAALEVKHRRFTKDDGSVGTETTYTQHDKLKALELLGKKLKLFVERHEVEHPQDALFKELLRQAREKRGEQ